MDMVLFTHQEIQMVLSEWEMANLLNHIYQNITAFSPGVYSNNICFILKFNIITKVIKA